MTNKKQDNRMKQYEAEIKEKPFTIIYKGERLNFGNDFKTQEEAIKEARKEVKLMGDKVAVCRRIAKLEDGQYGEEAETLVEFEREIIPPEKDFNPVDLNPVKTIKVKTTRAEVERLLKEREERWKKEHEEWERKNQAEAKRQKESSAIPQDIKAKVDAIRKKHIQKMTPEYLKGEIKKVEAVTKRLNKTLEEMRKELNLKTEAQKEARA